MERNVLSRAAEFIKAQRQKKRWTKAVSAIAVRSVSPLPDRLQAPFSSCRDRMQSTYICRVV